MNKYHYTMKGTAADNQSWETCGYLEIEPGDFAAISELALRDSFTKLTQGKAVFGLPGVGCKGPYKITDLIIKAAAKNPAELYCPIQEKQCIDPRCDATHCWNGIDPEISPP